MTDCFDKPFRRTAKTREWSTELFECRSDPESCLLSTFFPCCYIGYMAAKRDTTEVHKPGWITPCCCIIMCPWCWLKKEYRLTREKYDIPEGQFCWEYDWTIVCCCPFFAAMHMAREIDIRNPPPKRSEKFPLGEKRYENKTLAPPLQAMGGARHMTDEEYMAQMDDIIRVKAKQKG